MLQREFPTQQELSNLECLQMSLWKGREQQQSMRPYPGVCRGLMVLNQKKETLPNPACSTPAPSIHRSLTEMEIVVPSASKALPMMRPPDTGHPTN